MGSIRIKRKVKNLLHSNKNECGNICWSTWQQFNRLCGRFVWTQLDIPTRQCRKAHKSLFYFKKYPDLNPIEDLWGILSAKVFSRAKQYTTLKELKKQYWQNGRKLIWQHWKICRNQCLVDYNKSLYTRVTPFHISLWISYFLVQNIFKFYKYFLWRINSNLIFHSIK